MYHIGNNEYRLVNVFTGWPVIVENGLLVTKVWCSDSKSILQLEEAFVEDNTSWGFEMDKHFGKGKQGGLFKIRVKDSGELLSMSDMNVVSSTIKEADNWGEKEIIVYTSPTKEFLHVVLPEQMYSSCVSLYNMSGQLVYQSNKVFGNIIIPVGNETNGMYVLMITGKSNCYTQKVMIE